MGPGPGHAHTVRADRQPGRGHRHNTAQKASKILLKNNDISSRFPKLINVWQCYSGKKAKKKKKKVRAGRSTSSSSEREATSEERQRNKKIKAKKKRKRKTKTTIDVVVVGSLPSLTGTCAAVQEESRYGLIAHYVGTPATFYTFSINFFPAFGLKK
jgi:hypothetical protein